MTENSVNRQPLMSNQRKGREPSEPKQKSALSLVRGARWDNDQKVFLLTEDERNELIQLLEGVSE